MHTLCPVLPITRLASRRLLTEALNAGTVITQGWLTSSWRSVMSFPATLFQLPRGSGPAGLPPLSQGSVHVA